MRKVRSLLPFLRRHNGVDAFALVDIAVRPDAASTSTPATRGVLPTTVMSRAADRRFIEID